MNLFKKPKKPVMLRIYIGERSGPAVTNGKVIYREFNGFVPHVGDNFDIEKNWGVVLWVRYMMDGDHMHATEMIEIGVGCDHAVA